MVWLSVILVWFVLTVLRGRRDSFALGVLATGFAAILVVNAVNPDALIARVNADRMEAGERFDARYLTGLSADAVPVMIEALPAMDEPDRRIVQADLEAFSSRSQERSDWRTWNLSRSRALALVETEMGAPETQSASTQR
jgi:hypothetical protein